MLKTEMRNQNSTHIDRMTTVDMMRVMQNENINAAMAVEKELENISGLASGIPCSFNKPERLPSSPLSPCKQLIAE